MDRWKKSSTASINFFFLIFHHFDWIACKPFGAVHNFSIWFYCTRTHVCKSTKLYSVSYTLYSIHNSKHTLTVVGSISGGRRQPELNRAIVLNPRTDVIFLTSHWTQIASYFTANVDWFQHVSETRTRQILRYMQSPGSLLSHSSSKRQ